METVMNRPSRRWALLPACLVIAAATLAADSGIVLARSSIVATFRQENVPVDAPFRTFAGTVVYDPAKPATSHATLTVETASFDLGDAAYNAEVRKPAWFDSAHFPQATFVATLIKPAAAGHFDATGTLTIKGKVQIITVAITVQRVGSADAFEGSFDLSRKAFGIGDPSWEDVLDDKVRVRFHLLNAGA
jgi:polyisoprenoid-binding protein YceI